MSECLLIVGKIEHRYSSDDGEFHVYRARSHNLSKASAWLSVAFRGQKVSDFSDAGPALLLGEISVHPRYGQQLELFGFQLIGADEGEITETSIRIAAESLTGGADATFALLSRRATQAAAEYKNRYPTFGRAGRYVEWFESLPLSRQIEESSFMASVVCWNQADRQWRKADACS